MPPPQPTTPILAAALPLALALTLGLVLSLGLMPGLGLRLALALGLVTVDNSRKMVDLAQYH